MRPRTATAFEAIGVENLCVEERAGDAPHRRRADATPHGLHRTRRSCSRRTQHGCNLAQFSAHLYNDLAHAAALLPSACCRGLRRGLSWRRRSCLTFCPLCLAQSLPGARKRISLAINEPFDFDRDLNIAFAIEALAGAALIGLQLRKLRFPETKHIRLHFENARHIPDFEVETVGDRRSFNGALRGWMRCHSEYRMPAGRAGPLLRRSIGHLLHAK
jgi:hypothetical protein